jgi:hypothetical protein
MLDGQFKVAMGVTTYVLVVFAKELQTRPRRHRVERVGQLLSEREEPQLAEVSIDPGEGVPLRWLHGQHRPHDRDAGRPYDGDPGRTNDKALHAHLGVICAPWR